MAPVQYRLNSFYVQTVLNVHGLHAEACKPSTCGMKHTPVKFLQPAREVK